MRLVVGMVLATLLSLAQDWRTATELPGVSFEGLTGAQKLVALKVLRTFDCVCGRNMKLAQCRIEDPRCPYSKPLAELAVAWAMQGRGEVQIRQGMESLRSVQAARQRNRILLDPVPIRTEGSPARGAANAKVTLVEFSDFQCPYCAAAVAKLNAVLQAYPNDVRLVFKQFPLERHSQAALAAAATLAAHAQGKFWPLHDRIYADWRQLSRAKLIAWARESGVDAAKFLADLDAAGTRAAVYRDRDDGIRAGVEGTPTVFVNGKKYQGALEDPQFRAVIEAELKNR